MNSTNTQVIETTVSRDNIVDSFAQFLMATKVVSPSQEITNIQFSELFGVSDKEFTKIKIYIKEVKAEDQSVTKH